MTEAIFKLSDRRRQLSYASYGPETGRPVLYFHGTPSSRLEVLLLDNYGINLERMLNDAGLRLIAVDRPGMGFSTYNRDGDFLSFADDAKELLDHLGIASCAVMCWSGGGPYALAMAHRHPSAITVVHILCGFTRKFGRDVTRLMGLNKFYFFAARYTPFLLRTALFILSRKKIRGSVPQKFTGLPYEDYTLLKDPRDLDAVATNTMKQACRFGSKGAIHEARNYYRDFGFDVSEVRQPVHYWWGTKDMTVIRLHAETIERHAPGGTVHYREREGHLSLYVNYFHDVLQVISQQYPS
jgi:pimeloyl-ACP methyl ester carboxylesterase